VLHADGTLENFKIEVPAGLSIPLIVRSAGLVALAAWWVFSK